MQIKESMIYLGKPYKLVYQDADDFNNLPYKKCTQAYGICFCDGKIVLGFSKRMQNWSLIGGTIEPGETIVNALKREIQEESNMEVLKYWPIGYQKDVKSSNFQLRYACLVKPFGPFIADPDAGENNGVSKITLVNPKDFKKYVGWGKIGDRLIERALEKTKK